VGHRITENGVVGTCSTFIKMLFGNPEGERPLDGTICRWEDVIKMDVNGSNTGGYRLGSAYLVYDLVAGFFVRIPVDICFA